MPLSSARPLRPLALLAPLAVALLAPLGACARARPLEIRRDSAPAPSTSGSTAEVVFRTTADPHTPPTVRWVAWPDDFVAESALDLGDGTSLYVGSVGERWVATPDGARRTPAEDLADERLIAARPRDGGFLFVGERGAIYEAKSPLTPFTAIRRPAQPLGSVTVGAKAILGVLPDRRVVRSVDGGASFAAVALPRKPAVDAGAPSADDMPPLVLLSPRGHGLVALDPDTVFVTLDDGASFRRLDFAGLDAIGLTPTGDVLVRTKSRESRALDAGGSLVATKLEPARPMLPTPAGAVARPDTVHSGPEEHLTSTRYVILGARATGAPYPPPPPWREAMPPPRAMGMEMRAVPPPDTRKIVAWMQPLPEGPRTLAHLADLWSVWSRLGAGGDRLVFEERDVLRFSDDAGAHVRSGAPLFPDTLGGNRALWPLPSGAVIANGYCQTGSSMRDCAVHVPLFAPSASGPFAPLVPSTIGNFINVTQVVTDPTGTHVFALVTASEPADGGSADVAYLLASHDGGRSFRAVKQPSGSLYSLTVDARDPAHPKLVAFTAEERVVFADDLKTRAGTPLTLAVLERSMAGARGLLLERAGAPLMETADAGETWHAAEHAPAQRFDCVPLGCRFEGGVFRAGWALAKR
jgi:hypothetical protein